MLLELMLNWPVALTNYMAGVKSGIEDAIHGMTSLFLKHGATSGWGVVLVDASNASNSLNRVALLWNVRVL